MDRYDEVRRFFLSQPDVGCIRPFLGSFGEGDGLGVYQLVADVFRKLPADAVIRALSESLASSHRSVRYWSAQVAAEFPSSQLVQPLLALLKANDHDLKYAALTALEQSADVSVIPELERFSREESDEELRELAEEVAEGLRAN